ncbi:NAD-dependent epimerase/dehydratase family protein [Streptomyces sp. NPDC088258]|uniref:NAD-dependent epimerase/dehydratase family protein n=1 Tax=Streptomyces sp. NPDC088258 TaxID=3365849 RepID=UPI0037F1612B
MTGGLGSLGSHFVEELLTHGAHVTATTRHADPRRCAWLPGTGRLRVLELDLLEGARLRAALREAAPRVDAVFHCAGMDGNAEFKRRHSAQILDVNVRLAAHILNAARDAEIPTVVMAGSAETALRPETPAGPFVPGRSADGYARSKLFTEFLADLHRTQYGTRVFVPRFTNVYGPRDRFDSTARVIPAMLTRILAGDAVEVWGDGSQIRTFIHAADAVRATLQIAAQDHEHVVTIGTAETITMTDLARLIFDLLGAPERIDTVAVDHPQPGGRVLDVTTMNRLIDFTPRPLRDGIAETLRWYRAQHRAPRTLAPYAIRGT